MMEDGTFKVGALGQTFLSEGRVSKKDNSEYQAFGDFFGGLAFVKMIDANDNGPAAIHVSLTEGVNIPRAEGQTKSAGQKQYNPPAAKAAAPAPAKSKPSPKTTALVDNADENPW